MQQEGEGTSEMAPAIPGGTPFDQFMRRFFENPSPSPAQQITALGSGFIIDPEGDIVTNNHVVANASKVTIIFQDGSRHPAKVVGRDQKTDLALVKIKADKQLPFVTWGNSDDVEVGDWVVAVGNPFGLGGTVTAGIVSALGRNINEGPYDDFLQIDAPINRGNSGGPTFDLSGQVIGINTAIYSPSGGSVGIGFAVPSNIAKHVVAELKAQGKVDWGWLGVAIQNITPPIAKSLGLDQTEASGALIASVVPDSPAAKAGLKAGDVVTTRRRPHHPRRARLAAPCCRRADRQQARPDHRSRRQDPHDYRRDRCHAGAQDRISGNRSAGRHRFGAWAGARLADAANPPAAEDRP